MSKSIRNFLGLKITGEVYTVDQKDQLPQSDFEPFVKALLDDPYIREFGWAQYTPYFNDGDTCVFGAGGLWVLTVDDPSTDELDAEAEEVMGIDYNIHPTLGGEEFEGVKDGKPSYTYKGTRKKEWQKARALSKAIESGKFDAVLLKLFGDHASVKVTRKGIEIDSYEHD